MKHLSHQMCTSLLNQHCCSLSCSGTDTSGAFQEALVVKNPPANTGDTGSIPVPGRSPGEGNGNPLRYTCLENPMERGAWWASAHGVTETDTMEPTHARAHVFGKPGRIGGDKNQILPEKCGCVSLSTPWSMHGALQRQEVGSQEEPKEDRRGTDSFSLGLGANTQHLPSTC